jgi:RHS repeat-associated protein
MNETATSPGPATYTYDNAGNMITSKTGSTTTTFTYDYRNRLTNVTVGGTVTASYTYDALDRRIGVQESGAQTWTVYDGTSADANPYADFDGSGNLTERYLFGAGVVNGAVVDEILARTSSGGTTAWYLADKLGSVRDIVDTSGNVQDHIVYDSFGNIVTETNAANGDRFKFAAMQFDATTGQYYDHARWYGAGVGRFLSLDPKGLSAGDSNLLRYVFNDTTDLIDRSGEQPVDSTGVLSESMAKGTEMSSQDWKYLQQQRRLMLLAMEHAERRAMTAEQKRQIRIARMMIEAVKISNFYLHKRWNSGPYTMYAGTPYRGELGLRTMGNTYFSRQYFRTLSPREQIAIFIHEGYHQFYTLGDGSAYIFTSTDPRNPPQREGNFWAGIIYDYTSVGKMFDGLYYSRILDLPGL